MTSKDIQKILINKTTRDIIVNTSFLVEVMEALEVLETLKETIKNNVFDVAMLDARPNGETLLSCEDFGITLKTEDYYKIIRWLNNDN